MEVLHIWRYGGTRWMDQNMPAVKKPICPICPSANGFARKMMSEKETLASWGPVKNLYTQI